MTFNPDIHHRRSIRLREYDYSSVGAYFVTVCANGRECLFGDIANDEMRLNDAGRMVADIWNALPERFPFVELDENVIMPNHFHGVIILNDSDERRGDTLCSPAFDGEGSLLKTPNGTIVDSLGRVVQAFKSLTTVDYIHGVNERNWTSFTGRLWQRGYYERVIRNDEEMSAIRDYIRFNPLKWPLDKENPNIT